MLENIKIGNILFLDIETVPAWSDYIEMPENFKHLWDKKSVYFRKNEETAANVYQRAGIYAEFGKIVCISTGFVTENNYRKSLRIKSFWGDDEKIFLTEFATMVNKFFSSDYHFLCAHNGKEFDFPYIARRMLINNIKVPKPFDLAGKKSWEVKHLDTLELWKFGDYKHFTSLELLSAVFGIPTSKDDIDGSQVAEVYYKENDLKRIVKYCQKDVINIVQLFLKYRCQNLIDENDIILIDG